jgi:hypothetical protein
MREEDDKGARRAKAATAAYGLFRCPIVLTSVGLVTAVCAALLFYSTHQASSSVDESSPRVGWLRLHPPQQAHHDAEMLRRRTLANLEELGVADLATHVPQLVACLAHHDGQVRALALGMLGRLEPSAVAEHVERLSETLRLGSSDDAVKLYVLKTLTAIGDMPTIASSGGLVVECFSADSAEVRRATGDVLALLEPEELAPYTEAAAQAVAQRHDTELASALIMSWGWKLESEACRARAGEHACQGVLRGLRALANGTTALEV